MRVREKTWPDFSPVSKWGAHFPATNVELPFVAGKWAPPLETGEKSGRFFAHSHFLLSPLDPVITDNSGEWEIADFYLMGLDAGSILYFSS